jgi:vacuolar protein sorting-associated protein 13D
MEPLNQFSSQNVDLTPGDNVFSPFVKDDSVDSVSSVLQLDGRLITPLKLALSKEVYEQILQTLDNITPTDDEGPLESPRSDVTVEGSGSGHSLSNVSEERESSIHSSVSALKLDESPLSASMIKDKSFTAKEIATKPEENLVFKAYFEMPIFNVKMTGDLGEGEQGLVDLKLEDFKVNFEKTDPWSKSIEISLQSLIMEDLLQEKDSKHRFLMVSTQKLQGAKPEDPKLHLSQSCPTAMIDIPVTTLPTSLPSSFHEENVFGSPYTRLSHNTGKANVSSVTRRKSTRSVSYVCGIVFLQIFSMFVLA